MSAKRALIISPRIAIQKGDFLGSGVPYWPLEAAIFAAQLRQSGWDVKALDLFGLAPGRLQSSDALFWQGLPLDEALVTLDSEPSSWSVTLVYALSSMSHQDLLQIVMTLKSRGYPRITVFENSQAVTGYDLSQAAPFYRDAGAQFLLAGEPYSNWTELEPFLAGSSSTPPANVIDLQKQDAPTATRATRTPISTPVPAWDLFPFRAYWNLPYSHGPKSGPYFPMLTSRGCPYPCTFCVIPATNAQKWRARPAAEVVGEMETLQQQYGVSDFQWEDLNSTIDRERIQDICRLIGEKNLRVRFRLVSGTKVETLDVKTLEAMARGGCDYISISPESGSPRILQLIRKPFDHAHALAMVATMSQLGIHSQCCFVLGHPDETDEDRAMTESYVRQLVRAGVDEVAFFILSPLPGSALQKSITYADYTHALWSFTPKHRLDYPHLEVWRRRLIRRFLFWKLRYQPLRFLRQAWNAMIGTPATKMEMLPRRVLYVMAARRAA